ncbi:MAG TPA: acyl-CoA thioesterase domain-containing protein [Acidimicrobiales bacterium]|nr:acyl-CoA thioesterase domain-containing protein [Acidimicrobiales bacterium]
MTPGDGPARRFLQGEPAGDGSWCFAIGRERHGAFGGAFGGLLTACCVHLARAATGGRRAASVDARFVRGLPAGRARFVPTVVHDGRTLTTLAVDVYDEHDRVATRATVGLVAPGELPEVDHPGEAGPPPCAVPWEEGRGWGSTGPDARAGGDVPIVATFRPRAVGRGDRGFGTALPVPWEDDPAAFAEAACLAADMCVGPPVAAAFPGRPTPAPNPDLSLRFTGRPVGREVVGWGRLERIDHGLATTRVEVRSEDELVATGVSCSLLVGA